MASSEIVGVAHQVEGGSFVPRENTVGEPTLKQPGGLLVARLRVHWVGLLATFQMYGVIGTALLKFRLEFRTDHVVGWADH